MKKLSHTLKAFVFLLSLLTVKTGFAQNVGISSVSSFTPDASAALDVSFTNKGLLVPRVALTANNVAGPISSPATSLLVYNTATAGTSPYNVIPGYYYYNGSGWVMLSTATQTANAWSITGNSGTSYPTNYLGTTDNFGLHFKTAATHRLWIDSLGSVAIGNAPIFTTTATSSLNSNPNIAREKFLVDAGSTSANPATSFNVISGKGYIDKYLQLNIQNFSPTVNASSDVVATADNGTETTNYVDMGINSSANTAAYFGAANDAYLYNAGGTVGGNFFIGTSTSGKVLGFLTGGGATTNERMRIDGTGNVGIGTTTPSTKLHVFGANPLTLSGVVTGTNTTADSLLTITSGLVRKLPLSTFASTGNAWSTTGNTGTTAGTNFIGTTDATNFIVKTSNTEVARFSSDGNVAIGSSTTAFNTTNPEQLLVDAGTTSSTNVISGKGTINSFLQLNIQNLSTGTSASTDVVATADNGTDAANYVDMGINGSKNSATFYYGLANDAYLYNTGGSLGGNFYIGTSTSGKVLAFLTGGTAASNERMRIDGTGNVGIGTTAPAQKLDVTGSIRASTSVISQGSVLPDAAVSNTGTLLPGLQLGGSGSGEGISSKRTSGTNQYGLDFYTASSSRMSITQTGSVGIGTNTPTSTLNVNGSISVSVTTQSASYIILATDYIIINTSTATTGPTFTLPPASGCAGRMYRIINHGTASITISPAVNNTNTGTTSTLGTGTGGNVMEVVSDGTSWQRANQ